MTSFWKTMFDVGLEKVRELGAIGVVFVVLWLVGVFVFWDWAVGSFRERVETAGLIFSLILTIWVLVGVLVYLWKDPHDLRKNLSLSKKEESKNE